MILSVQRLQAATAAVLLLMLGMVASPTAKAQYCEPCCAYQWNPGVVGITKVQVGSFVRNSAPNEGAPCYYLNTGATMTLLRNTTYPATVTGAWADPSLYPIYHMVWIDLNVDGDFLDAGEVVYQGYPPQTWGYVWGWYYTLVYGGSVNFNLNLPCTVPQGTTRMRVGASYYNYMGSNPCIRNTYYSEWEDYTLDIAGDVTGSFPNDNTDQNSILTRNLYDGSSATYPKPSIQMRAVSANQQYEVTYRLQGPAPLTNNVFIGHEPGNPNDTTITVTGPAVPTIFTYEIPAAKGVLAGTAGALDARNAIGGEYQVFITVRGAGGGGCYTEWTRAFTIAVPNDLSTREIRSPRQTSATFKYPNTAAVPIEAQFQNVGLNVINKWKGHARIWKDGVLKFTDSSPVFDEVLDPKERATVVFNSFTSTTGHEVGIYDVEVCSEMVDPAFDDNTFNDCFPRPTATYRFEIAYNEEASAIAIVRPASTTDLYAGRPHRVEGMFQNNGIIDLSNVPVELTVTRLSDNQVVFTRSTILPDLPAGQFNRSTIVFAPFTPDRAGMYKYCIKVKYPGDPVASNDEFCATFEVKASLAGTYTIGTLKQNDPRNFLTFEAAADALYRRGVSGPVKFQMTDASYTVGSAQTGRPAYDLSSTIIGVNSTNTITFEPDLNRSLSKGSVTIRLRSGNGVGIFTGTNLFPANSNAIQADAEFSSALYAKSNGNIHFNGGAQRSLKFLIDFTGTSYRSVLYFGPGSTNCSVKNCIISDFGTPSYTTTLPQARYNSGSNEFRFDPDFTASATYSAGIISRDTTPTFNQAGVDTIPNTNLVFENNEISKFGYGVVSTGLGILLKSGVNQYIPYYNKGTQIRNNVIYDVRRAGVFVGYEDGAMIEGNRIYNVGVTATNGATNDANGILAGGEGRYHNINLTIARNEISGVVGNTMSRGISVEQSRNDFQSVSGGVTPSYPNVAEHTLIHSNSVWGLRRGTASGHMAGIHVFTRRATTSWTLTDLLNPYYNNYYSRKDSVVNNTILHQSDNITGTGAIIGIGVQHADGPVVMNNAVALQGLSGATNSVHTALFNEGTMFRTSKVYTGYLPVGSAAALTSDRNAFWAPNATIARFVETIPGTTTLIPGTDNEFTVIAQWRSWTGQDINSVVGDFTTDHVFLGIAPNQRLRVRTTPQTPIGSILNNRGARIAGVKKDVDNNDRGPAGQGYDLGANEFAGRLYVSDLEVVDIIKPTSYRSLTGSTSDAEYIMTTAPVDVTSRIRNVGSLSQTQGKSRVRIFLETAASASANQNPPTFSTTPVIDKTINVALNSGDEANYVYNLTNFTPQTFAQLAGYTAPSAYSTMTWNVTPRYRVEVSVQSDENNTNNTQVKTYRFYLMMAQTRIAVSTRGSATTLTPSSTQNEIAGRLNADSLVRALNRVGFVNNPSANTYAYDVFDRNAWEGRAVDYSMYRTLFWAHDQNPMTRTERDDIRAFLASGSMQEKKNFAMGSQEPPRDHVGMDVNNDEAFIRTVLRVTLQSPGSPINTNNYSGKKVVGQAIARNTEETVLATTWPGDAVPNPVLVRMYSDATTPGIALASYKYKKGDRTTNDSLGGAARASLAYNTVYLGVDWRHYQNTGAITGTERVLRGVIDFFETNGGTVVPVELTAFDAQGRGSNVDVFWTTASEQNSDHFDVERAAVTPAGTTDFTSVASVPAAGNTTTSRDYRAADLNVAPGTYLYRLKAVDMDGSSSLSHDVQVVIASGDALSIGNVTPNPVTSEAAVMVTVPTSGDVDIRLFDIAGNEVMVVANTIQTAGRHEVRFSAMNLASGSYTLVVRANGATASTPVTIVK